ncbi:hypothetical protein SARC_14780 [Sphaeroforma arctica JP610]|uniref:C2 domain-containing protein n=1 Tax=Sphaeroforma arctica JP610 TaxID=667725 RepID=A0A0L0F7L3_9EUKA|nr:hypothetical protein SARC_14780 [Sphaeroforma arctica JP610]KNC72659.1 hypothetical protein SARC_14780 [Sphaeroforma arctica JP610]|eukprot:XP_014146561.1 hypothetical protein SARC_14780 [Sphaeroforma arctica JP610]
MGKHKITKTKTIENTLDPVWDEEPIKFPLNETEVEDILFKIKDRDLVGSDTLGFVRIVLKDLLEGKKIDGWFPLSKKSTSKPGAGSPLGEIKISVQFVGVY